MPNGDHDYLDPNVDYKALLESQGVDVPEGTLGGTFEESDLHIGTEDLYEIAGAGFSGIQEGYDQFKDLLDSLSGGLTKVYKQLYILVAGGLVLWGYSIYKK